MNYPLKSTSQLRSPHNVSSQMVLAGLLQTLDACDLTQDNTRVLIQQFTESSSQFTVYRIEFVELSSLHLGYSSR